MTILEDILATARRTNTVRSKSALYDLHPELQERIPLLRVYSEEAQSAGGVRMADFYTTNTWVHKAIKVLSDNLSPLTVNVVEVDGTGEQILPDHEISQLLANPNPEMDPASLWREWTINMMLGGEIGFEAAPNRRGQERTADGRVLELWPREGSEFYVRKGELGRRYRRVAGYKIDDNEGDPYDLRPDQFIHFKFYNPLNPWRGLTPIMAVRTGVIIDQLAQAWSRLFFRNNARPDFAVIAPEGITRSEKEDIYLELDQRTGGGEGVHRPLILEKGVTDIKTFSFPPKDLEWIEQRKLARDEIGAIFGVPDGIMGWGQESYDTQTKLEGDMRAVWLLTLVPLIGLRDATLTRFFRKTKQIEMGQKVATDLSGVGPLQEDRSEKFDQFDKLAGRGYPINALNEYFGLGLPEVRGGDVGYLPLGLIPVTSTNGGKNLRQAQLAHALNLLARAVEEGRLPEQRARLHPGVTLKKEVPEYGSAAHEALWKAKQARLDSPVESMQRILKREFQRQQNQVSRRLRDGKVYGRGKFAGVARNANKQDDDEINIPDPESLFDLEAEVQLFIAALSEFIHGAIERIAGDELAGLGVGVEFAVDRPEVQAGIRHVLETVARKTNETTWEGLIELFQEAEAAGEGIPAIQERLSAFFGDRKSDWQTERIARTTMTGAANFGSLEAWDQSGVVDSHSWISALLPNRTREAHAQAHGQTRKLREAFDVGGEQLMYPGDPNGNPENIINCLCVTQPNVMEE